MRAHTANELYTTADIVGPDGSTVQAPDIACGITDLSGRRLEQAQLVASETTHSIVFRTVDAAALTNASYIRCEGVLYAVDYLLDPRNPRPRVWTEAYCHAERAGN